MIYAADIVIDKAKTAIGFRRPTIALERTIDEGRSAMLGLINTFAYAPLKGAYPIEMEGEMIGAIAVGGTLNADLDEVIVLAALKALK
jgi:glc operon protein GlcG